MSWIKLMHVYGSVTLQVEGEWQDGKLARCITVLFILLVVCPNVRAGRTAPSRCWASQWMAGRYL